ncbi:glyceraldehyde-3-phosphate dehydrogenase 2 [Anaplasma platys]|uniref:Glyceraldehyde-3-phosphate dehydrogenase 2 n=1 Tax=Anaplasma platys TaxID=949 RepID=A0A858PX35_9RICK|nr:type I glyceraldehyde-3-phosphate dehydrogenase [Anaplasma platys]QJC27145.1 glyceraldehyde-3-phosphate dehydrogenase 2 [Anaplasma platys]
MIRVGINGLGRIGRCLFRLLCDPQANADLQLVAVNGSSDINLHRHLIQNDSAHGKFSDEITLAGGEELIVRGRKIKFFREREPENVSWASCNVDVVLECTGKFNKRALAAKHLGTTVKHVVVSAPVSDADLQVIYGINERDIARGHEVISVGSCTTNCAAHVVRAVDEEFGICGGFITTVHAYTNDQNHLDGSHKDFRRARACGLSMVPTSTGASKALAKLFPHLEGKLSAAAIRVPTPNVSLVDFTVHTERAVTTEDINGVLLAAAAQRSDVLCVTSEPMVSVDFNHSPYSAVFDLLETYVSSGNFARVLAWYDNEWAFACRMVDVARQFARIKDF